MSKDASGNSGERGRMPKWLGGSGVCGGEKWKDAKDAKIFVGVVERSEGCVVEEHKVLVLPKNLWGGC